MKFNSPLPQPLAKECAKASRIFRSFVDGSNNGLDGVIPRSVLENARGLAIFTVVKAGFLFSARAGSGVVIARLQDGSWSAPSAIGTAGVGVGGQAGAEMTDFLVVLNSRSAVASFMSAGSVTLGGNLSIAVGPLGRNGEASGSLNTKGKVAAMYSYSKTRGLFGGVSLEGSVIVQRSDANAQAYRSDVTAKMLLSGAIPPPEWAAPLINTLEQCTGMPGNRRWVAEHYNNNYEDSYMFGGVESPRDEGTPSRRGAARPSNSRTNSYFDFSDDGTGARDNDDLTSGRTSTYEHADKHNRANSTPYKANGIRDSNPYNRDQPTTEYFGTKFDSDYNPNGDATHRQSRYSTSSRGSGGEYPFHSIGSDLNRHKRSNTYSAPRNDNPFDDDNDDYAPRQSQSRGLRFGRGSRSYDFNRDNDHRDVDNDRDVFGAPIPNAARGIRGSSPPPPSLAPKAELTQPLKPSEGIARAIALFDFNAVQSGDLSFKKGQVITVTEMSDNTDTWWHGKLEGRTGVFPANFVEVV